MPGPARAHLGRARLNRPARATPAAVLLGLLAMLPFPFPARGCTIGVAAGSATADGRPLVWKTRDLEGMPNSVLYDSSAVHGFVSVINSEEPDLSWMGVNDAGFAVVNSYTYAKGDRRAELENGSLMHYALGECATVADFQALLDSTNVTGRNTLGNFAVIDAGGAAAMFEVTADAYVRFDPPAGEEAFVVRANFAFSSGWEQTGRDRYDRSLALLGEYTRGDSLSARTILRGHMRDFSNASSTPLAVPYAGREQNQWPQGYVACDHSICRSSSVSAAVIQGVLPGEAPFLSTLWVLLGQPASTLAVPYWPVGPAPAPASAGARVPLWAEARRLQAYLLRPAGGAMLIDTYALRDGRGGGLWSTLFPAEDAILDEAEAFLAAWRLAAPSPGQMLAVEGVFADQALEFLQDTHVDKTIVADFTVDRASGCAPYTVSFRDACLHDPVLWQWDLDGDGDVDSQRRDPEWVYPAAGTYSVSLRVRNAWSETILQREDLIFAAAFPSAPTACEASRDRVDGVLVSWQDNSVDEAEFIIFRDGTRLATVSAGESVYADGSALPGVEHDYQVVAANECGESVASNAALGMRVAALALRGPVPFRETVAVEYAVPAGVRFTLDVFDPTGRRIRRLAEGHGDARVTSVAWDGCDAHGVEAPAGLYLLSLDTGRRVTTRRALLIR